MSIIITIIYALLVLLVLSLVLWVISRYVVPIEQKLQGLIIAIAIVLLIIYAIAHGGIYFR
jgi:hypothetical protein